jgi:hypothetical protein
MELAHAFGMVKTLRFCIKQINGLFPFDLKGTSARYKSALEHHCQALAGVA